MPESLHDPVPLHGPLLLHDLVAVWPHLGRPAQLVRELKYGRATAVVTELAEAMAEAAPFSDLVTWVPASPSRRRRRGFDQGELLARAVARRLDRPVRALLRRVDNVAQTSRDLAGRVAGPEFARRGRRLRSGPAVLVIDDVCTSGASLRAAAEVLRSAGAGRVVGLVATRATVTEGPILAGYGDLRSTTTRPPGGQEWTSPSVHGM